MLYGLVSNIHININRTSFYSKATPTSQYFLTCYHNSEICCTLNSKDIILVALILHVKWYNQCSPLGVLAPCCCQDANQFFFVPPQPPFYSRNTAEMYDNILNKPLQLKPNISNAARHLLEGLLQKDRTKRLGCTEDFVSVWWCDCMCVSGCMCVQGRCLIILHVWLFAGWN